MPYRKTISPAIIRLLTEPREGLAVREQKALSLLTGPELIVVHSHLIDELSFFEIWKEIWSLRPPRAKRLWTSGIRKLAVITALQRRLRLEDTDQIPISEIADLVAPPTLLKLKKGGVQNLAELSLLRMKELRVQLEIHPKEIIQIECTLQAVGLRLLPESEGAETSV